MEAEQSIQPSPVSALRRPLQAPPAAPEASAAPGGGRPASTVGPLSAKTFFFVDANISGKETSSVVLGEEGCTRTKGVRVRKRGGGVIPPSLSRIQAHIAAFLYIRGLKKRMNLTLRVLVDY